MTEPEIKKALDLCGNFTIDSCKSCPCNSGSSYCERLKREALELINRQEAEIKRLKNELHGKVDYIHEQQEVIDSLKKERDKKRSMDEQTIREKFNKLEGYSEDNYCAYKDGYFDGQTSGIHIGCMALRRMILEEIHLLPTTMGYTEELFDACSQSIIDDHYKGKYL